ncbi:PhzF family phenazine biosynthesis protein [Mesorhizobium sp. RMAD-H1]|uniref:PhzF family phenazine biosynthesis protein n=1 Tax=Mesorhizobium sp. RMAD-H1 TaxID=2587065 RepID=UPI0016229D62|nr:PhzF family phenazine biosynthesis protein [Mesorhizobium sp. RMAD-H1]MBB2971047.1 trans-2,3-dihydro-3-hydroxyanthranilate isomerase [Mesorhizobium sp. RMAD-H1]
MDARPASGRPYEIYDVFTGEALSGNPLAIVHDADGLDEKRMQAIAREFNLSETVFVTSATNPIHTAAIRIFTPEYELPFAGHPTVGTAIALAARRHDGENADVLIALEEKIGVVRCGVGFSRKGAFAEFDLPRLAERLDIEVEKEVAAAALGVGTHEIGFENHVPSVWSGGVPYLLIPVHNLITAAKISVDTVFVRENLPKVDGRQLPIYAYCRETRLFDSDFHARMFVTGGNHYEDPATGSAVAAFAGAIHHFDRPVDGVAQLWIEQGMEMGRPSRIRLELDIENRRIAGARIGGSAIKVAEGTLFV